MARWDGQLYGGSARWLGLEDCSGSFGHPKSLVFSSRAIPSASAGDGSCRRRAVIIGARVSSKRSGVATAAGMGLPANNRPMRWVGGEITGVSDIAVRGGHRLSVLINLN
jgi:hypothetical protein